MSDHQEVDKRRAELLADLLTGAAWREIVEPALKGRQADLQRRLATTVDNVADMRFDQGCYRTLEQLLMDPKGFFRERT